MRKRFLFGTGALLALVVGGKLRSRATVRSRSRSFVGARANPIRQRERGHFRLIAFLVYLLFSPLWWKPWDPVVDAWQGVSNEVKELVRSVANEIWAYLDETFGFVFDMLDTLKRTTSGIWNGFVEFARNLYEGLKGWVLFAITLAKVELWGAIANVIGGVASLAQDVYNRIRNATESLLNWIANRVQWIYDNWISPLMAGFWNILKWVPEQIANAINWINANLIQPVTGWALRALHLAEDLWNWFIRTAKDAVELVMKAAWLLIIAASYGPDYWIRWVDEQMRRMPSVIASWAENAVSSEGDKIENWISRWLGV